VFFFRGNMAIAVYKKIVNHVLFMMTYLNMSEIRG